MGVKRFPLIDGFRSWWGLKKIKNYLATYIE